MDVKQAMTDDAGSEDASRPVVQFFGQHLLRRGLISEEALQQALTYQESVNLPLGALALSKGVLSEGQVLRVHTALRGTDLDFGEVAVQKGFMTRPQLDELLKARKESRVFLGEALVQRQHLTREQLDAALQDYQDEQVRAEARVLADLRKLNEFLIILAVQLTTRMLLRMGGQVAKMTRLDQRPRLTPKDYLLWQEVGGGRPFTYGLSLNEPQLLTLARNMLGDDDEPPTEVDDLVLDVGMEFVNTVVGHVCTWLGREGVSSTPSPPQAVSDEGAALPASWAGETRWVNVYLVLPRGQLVISVLSPS